MRPIRTDRELSFHGFVHKDHFNTLLDKVRDLDRVIRFLDSGVDPELTRYDVLSRSTKPGPRVLPLTNSKWTTG